jgi:hypothetical protein
MILYFPPKATLGLARRRVSGLSRSPLPPARTIAMVFLPTPSMEYIGFSPCELASAGAVSIQFDKIPFKCKEGTKADIDTD